MCRFSDGNPTEMYKMHGVVEDLVREISYSYLMHKVMRAVMRRVA